MKSDVIDRRDMMKVIALGSAAILPLPSLAEPLAAAATTPYAPKFFSPAELELVATLGELILPQTDTPGARAAKVHEHVDLVLSDETEDVQHDFRDGLVWLERRSRELYGDGFLKLGPDKQTALLTRISSGEAKRPEDEPGREP